MDNQEILETLKKIEYLLRMQTIDVVGCKEAAALLNISESRIYHMCASRMIPHYRNSRNRIQFSRRELEEWVLGDRIPTEEELAAKAQEHVVLNPITRYEYNAI
ncbi:MAG: helix-turn-helix domain-containing protein [Bacteroidales bacterium]|nr:helix-turn-helix domain-containing protein [Bacteroidales bacterium]